LILEDTITNNQKGERKEWMRRREKIAEDRPPQISSLLYYFERSRAERSEGSHFSKFSLLVVVY